MNHLFVQTSTPGLLDQQAFPASHRSWSNLSEKSIAFQCLKGNVCSPGFSTCANRPSCLNSKANQSRFPPGLLQAMRGHLLPTWQSKFRKISDDYLRWLSSCSKLYHIQTPVFQKPSNMLRSDRVKICEFKSHSVSDFFVIFLFIHPGHRPTSSGWRGQGWRHSVGRAAESVRSSADLRLLYFADLSRSTVHYGRCIGLRSSLESDWGTNWTI